MSLLSEKKRSGRYDDVVDPAVKYVRKQRELNNEDEKDKKLIEKLESDTLNSGVPKSYVEYMNVSTMTKQLASELWAERMAKKMIDWVKGNQEALTLTEFYISVGILSQDFCELARKYPLLGKAQEYVRMVIGDRRERGMLSRKLDPGATAYTMPNYLPEWKKIVEWRASLRQSSGDPTQPRIQYVVIPEIPNSGLVKERITESKDVQAADKNTESRETPSRSSGS